MEQGFPGQHTTTTTVTASSAPTSIRFDVSYAKTLPGMLKIAQAVSIIHIFIPTSFSYLYFSSIRF